MIESNKHNTAWRSDIICPYCGEEQMDSWEILGHETTSGDVEKWECGHCHRDFDVTIHLDPEYSSHCAEDEHDLVTEEGKSENKGRRYVLCENCDYSAFIDERELADRGVRVVKPV